MIEAVGHEHLQAYFRTLGAMVPPGGKVVIQVSQREGAGEGGGVGWVMAQWVRTPHHGSTDGHSAAQHGPCKAHLL